ncbi:MAG: Hsp70 family protein, partial [Candidatus Rokubacteria bacterium]|nr:Hsp70 family protein [Candidatus Rokubacteria bacterium]
MTRAVMGTRARLGVDFGTTRVVVAAADRGNYPVLSFETGDGRAEWFPPLVALRGPDRRYGWDAWALQGERGWTVVRSLKRVLVDAGPDSDLEVDGARHPVLPLLAGMAGALRQALGRPDTPEVMLGVPANANSNQRYLTVEAFRQGGFQVLGLLNEPSAAAVEFGHREGIEGRLLVYDLGGGTFDASLVELDERTRTVLASEGIATLGGDDFDLALAELVVGETRLDALSAPELFRLLEECRRQKEALHPNTRRIAVDLDHAREGWGRSRSPSPTSTRAAGPSSRRPSTPCRRSWARRRWRRSTSPGAGASCRWSRACCGKHSGGACAGARTRARPRRSGSPSRLMPPPATPSATCSRGTSAY